MSIIFLLFILLVLVIVIAAVVVVLSISNRKRGRRSSNSDSVYNAPAQTTSQTLDTKVCPNCNTPIGEGISFCMMCGTKVK